MKSVEWHTAARSSAAAIIERRPLWHPCRFNATFACQYSPHSQSFKTPWNFLIMAHISRSIWCFSSHVHWHHGNTKEGNNETPPWAVLAEECALATRHPEKQCKNFDKYNQTYHNNLIILAEHCLHLLQKLEILAHAYNNKKNWSSSHQ